MERTNFIKWCFLCALTMVLFSCQSKTSNNATEQEVKTIVPVFNADSCFSFLKAQTDFGARVPNTMAHKQCGDYLVRKLQQYGAQITEQEVVLNAYDATRLQARNIIASWKSETNNRILLCAHWDSRPFCDEDPIPANRMQPVMGANDGASGVAVLLEIARLMAQHTPRVGVDIIFFDAEDYGSSQVEHSFCLGSQYWAKNPHKRPYIARFGILLDMVGGKNPVFAKDQVSMLFAPDIANMVWDKAAQLGYSNVFVSTEGGSLIDDHYYVNALANIPCIDIIHFQNEVGFPAAWHTADDVIEQIDRHTLQVVGTVVTEVLYQLK